MSTRRVPPAQRGCYAAVICIASRNPKQQPKAESTHSCVPEGKFALQEISVLEGESPLQQPTDFAQLTVPEGRFSVQRLEMPSLLSESAEQPEMLVPEENSSVQRLEMPRIFSEAAKQPRSMVPGGRFSAAAC